MSIFNKEPKQQQPTAEPVYLQPPQRGISGMEGMSAFGAAGHIRAASKRQFAGAPVPTADTSAQRSINPDTTATLEHNRLAGHDDTERFMPSVPFEGPSTPDSDKVTADRLPITSGHIALTGIDTPPKK